MDEVETTGYRPVTRAMRWMLWIAAFFVLSAGIQLFVLSSHTDRFFARTIGTPLIAAILGAGAVLAWWRTAPELFARRPVEPLQPAS